MHGATIKTIIAYWGDKIERYLFLNFSLHSGEWSASQPGLLTKENGSLILVK